MTTFEFNGDWEFDWFSPEFIQSNANWNEGKIADPNRPIRIEIQDLRNYDPDPTPEQLASINHLFNEPLEVLNWLCKAMNKINQLYGDRSGEYDWYPSRVTPENLGTILTIYAVEILTEHKDGLAYLQFRGGYAGDHEHGLIVATHKDRLIGFNQVGEDCYGKIFEDLGEQGPATRDYNIRQNQQGNDQIHAPLPKYGKLKPWQSRVNEEHFANLIRQKRNDEVNAAVESHQWDLNFKFEHSEMSLLDLAVYHHNLELIKQLISRGADTSNTLHVCIHKGSFREDSLKCLVKNGITLNTILSGGYTPLGYEIKNYLWYMKSRLHYVEDDPRLKRANHEMSLSAERIKLYLELGAHPKMLDESGLSLKSFLEKHGTSGYVKEFNVFDEIHKILISTGNIN